MKATGETNGEWGRYSGRQEDSHGALDAEVRDEYPMKK